MMRKWPAGDHTEKRQQDTREDVGRTRTTVGKNCLACPTHVLGFRRIAGELERKVCLYARADIQCAARE